MKRIRVFNTELWPFVDYEIASDESSNLSGKIGTITDEAYEKLEMCMKSFCEYQEALNNLLCSAKQEFGPDSEAVKELVAHLKKLKMIGAKNDKENNSTPSNS